MTSASDPRRQRLSPEAWTALLVLGTTAGMLIPLAVWLLRDPQRFLLETLGLGGPLGSIPWGWALCAIVVVAYTAYTFWAVPSVRRNARSCTGLKALAIPLALASGTLEELVFRKFLMDWLDAVGTPAVLAVLASGIGFGLTHSVWVLFSRDARIILPVAAATTALGMALALTYLASDRLILPAIVAHIAINLVIEPWLLLSSVNGSWREAAPERHSRAGGAG